MIAKTPLPPYYAVIFTSIRNADDNSYSQMGEEMEKLVEKQANVYFPLPLMLTIMV